MLLVRFRKGINKLQYCNASTYVTSNRTNFLVENVALSTRPVAHNKEQCTMINCFNEVASEFI